MPDCKINAGGRKSMSWGALLLLGSVSSMALATPALAQEAASQQAADVSDADEIVITAQRRSERLIDVPVSVAAVSAQALEAGAAQDINDVDQLVPNLRITARDGLGASVQIRGVGADSRNIGFDTRVGVYLDGIYLGQSPAFNQDLVDLARVEVLRGPQGSLFGKNTVAGAINLVTKKPSDEFEGTLRGRFGNLDLIQVAGYVNVPLSDNTAFKVSGNREKRDGTTINLTDGEQLGERDIWSARAQVKTDPNEDLSILLSVDAFHSDGNPLSGDNLTDAFGIRLDTTAPKPREVRFSIPTIEDRDIFGASLTVNQQVGDAGTINSITAYRKTDFQIMFDSEWEPANFFITDYTDKYDNFTQEFQFISSQGERLEYLVGAYYFFQDAFTRRDVPAQADVVFLPFGITPGGGAFNSGTVKTNNYALYGNATYDITDNLELGVGARVSKEKKSVDWTIDGTRSGLFGIATGTLRDDRTDNDISPSATITYSFNRNLKTYLRYAEGYKSGGYNLDYITDGAFPGTVEFDKETVKSYEAGLKGSVAELGLNFNLAAFLSRFSDYQVNQFRDLGGGRTVISITNASSVETKGFELEASIQPAEGFSLSGGFGILDAKFDKFPGGGIGGADVSGKRLPFASKFQSSVAADYRTDLSGSGLFGFAHLDYNYRGSFYTTADNIKEQPLLGGGTVPFGFVEGYGLVNARLGIGSEARGWELSVWARNLFDNFYLDSDNRDFFGTIIQFYGEPRTYGVELSYKF